MAQVTPILVKLYDTHRLHALARNRTPAARCELAQIVVDLLDRKLGVRESELVADILIDLIRQAEHDLRMALSDRLAMLGSAPLRVILHLATDDIDVARPVLEHSPVLGDSDLVYIIKSKGADYWRAIATRARMGESVLHALVDTCDLPTAQTLAENRAILLTDHALGVLGVLAHKSPRLARPLILRPEIPADLAAALYKAASEDLQARVTEKFSLPEAPVKETLDDLLKDFSAQSAESGLPTDAMLQAARSALSKGLITMGLMMDTLARGQTGSFVALMSAYARLSPEVTISILEQPSGDRLAGLCRGLGIDKSDFLTVFRLTQRLRSKGGIATGHALARAQSAYERIDRAHGEKFLDACRRSAPKT